MPDKRLFTPLPSQLRQQIAEEYVAYALRRDGEPDVGRRTLARREEYFRQLSQRPPVCWDGEAIDPVAFRQWHRGERPLRDAPALSRWLVRIARANEGEGWGVEYLLQRGGFDGLGRGGRPLRPRDFADLEETYHTRIFREVARLFGLEYELRRPPRVIRASVMLMARLPQRSSYLLLLAGEIMGTVAFLLLATQGEELLASRPAVRDRVRELLDEILVDEVGHVTFLLGSMTRLELTAVIPLALLYLATSRVGYYDADAAEAALVREGIANYSLAYFPERVLRRAFVPAPYWPDAFDRPPWRRNG